MNLQEEGVNLVWIRDLLGHESVQTTEIYARTASKQRQEAIAKASETLNVKPNAPVEMKVLLVNGSPHWKGETYNALSLVETALNEKGIGMEWFWIGNKPVRGCRAAATVIGGASLLLFPVVEGAGFQKGDEALAEILIDFRQGKVRLAYI